MVALPVAAALTYFAVQHRSELPSFPDPTALIMNLRHQVAPFRFTLRTSPESPRCDTPFALNVHVVDPDGQPVDHLIIDADASMSGMDHGTQHVTLRGKGHGNYEGRLELNVVGSWDVDLSTTRNLQRARQRISLEVGEAQASPEPRNPNEDNSES
jgi:hypothetical protein